MRGTAKLPATFSPWATWTAVNPDGAMYEFEAEPERDVIAGVHANAAGTDFEFGEPVETWEPPEDTWCRFVARVTPPADWKATKRRI